MASDESREGDQRLERTVTLTDAVVAIAMTLLVLPLVEFAPEADRDGLGSFVNSHQSLFLGYTLSFLVIYLFWAAHERAFARVEHSGAGLRALNMLWLLGIAFLPFPTALVGRHATTSSAPFYICTMFVVSALTSAMTQLTARATPGQKADSHRRRHAVVSWASTAVFGACTLVSAVKPDPGLLGLSALVLVRVIGGRWADGEDPEPEPAPDVDAAHR